MEMSNFFVLNTRNGIATFKPYADFPGVISDHYRLTPDGVNTQSGTTYTLTVNDDGRVIVFTSGSAITLTIPSELKLGFSCSVVQYGAGQVTFSAGSGVTLRLRSGSNKTGGQYAVTSLISVVEDEYIVTGDTTT